MCWQDINFCRGFWQIKKYYYWSQYLLNDLLNIRYCFSKNSIMFIVINKYIGLYFLIFSRIANYIFSNLLLLILITIDVYFINVQQYVINAADLCIIFYSLAGLFLNRFYSLHQFLFFSNIILWLLVLFYLLYFSFFNMFTWVLKIPLISVLYG